MELRGWAHRLAEVAAVLGAGVAVYIAWDKVFIEHGEGWPVVIAAGFGALAIWVILSWLGIVRGPRFLVWGYKLPNDKAPPSDSN